MPQLFEVLRDMYEHNNTFPDNVTGDTRDVLLMYSIFKEKDMEAVLLSKSYGEYLSRTRDKDPKMKSLLSEASISVFKTKLPFNYESNKALHLMLLPQLEKVYDQYKRNLRQAKGVVPYEKALSFVLDKYIFNLTKPYFQNELNKLAILETNKATSSVANYCKREHLERLFILSEEVKRDLIPEDQEILLSDLTRGRYKSKVREYAGDIDYPGLMISCPDSVKEMDFEMWLEMALKTADIEIKMDKHEALVEKEEESTPIAEEKTFDTAMNPPEEPEAPVVDRNAEFRKKYEKESVPEELKSAAFNYAIKLGFYAHMIAQRLQEQSMSETDAYKNVPKYILEKRGKIDKASFDEFTKKFC